MRCFLGLFAALLASWVAQGANTQATLWLSESAAKPGATITAAVYLKMNPKWHTYWVNPGDSGKATKINWELPKGITAGEALWPLPEKHKLDDIYTYIYHDETALLVPLTIAADAPTGAQKIRAKVDWLECEVACIPGAAAVEVELVIGPESKPSAEAARIESWKAKIPKAGSDVEILAQWEGPAQGDDRWLVFTVNKPEGNWDYFNYRLENADIKGNTERLQARDGKVAFRKLVQKFDGDWPKELMGVVLIPGDASSARETKVAINEGAAQAAGVTVVSEPSSAQKVQPLIAILGLAFVGGLILNIMPCVLPVIALKILGFVRQSESDPRRVLTLGLVYTVGVVVSFLALAAFVIVVKQSGAASWGMQMQNPKFVIGMATLVTLIALNLFGVFEINLGGAAMGAAGNLAAKEGPAGAFFNGALATLLATPCTAPFLAPALGFAFTQSAGVIIATFVAVALGMASPYLVLSWFPGWLKILPKPGAWMESFKHAMGFPMIATAIWLCSVSLAQFGREVALPLGLFLATVALAAWIYGEFVQRGSKRRGLSGGIAVATFVFACAYFLPQIKKVEGWQAWSPAAVEAARAKGRPVLVDFTAEWCLTCKVNKRSIQSAAVQEKLKSLGAVTMIADNTDPKPEIVAELQRYNRAGVPMVLVFPADPKAPAILLPEFLTPGIVLDALEKAGGGDLKLSGK